MTRKKLALILSTTLLAALALGIGLGFALANLRRGNTASGFDQAISHLEYYTPGSSEPQLVDIELGLTHRQLENKFPGMEIYAYPSMEFCVCVYQNQRALVFFDIRDEVRKVNGYAVYNDRREPLEVNLHAAYPYYYGQMAPAALADADFENLTLYDLMEQYGLGYSNSSSLGYATNILLSDGRVMHLGGTTIGQCEAYHAFEEFYFGSMDFLCRNNDLRRPISSDTYMNTVDIWDIFEFKPGMTMEDRRIASLIVSSWEEIADKNSACFLHSLKEHPPEGWNPDAINNWIARYMQENN